MTSSDYSSREVGIAFTITIIAGLSTAVGGVAVFFPRLANRRYLSGSLALAAGAVFYIAMVDLFPESIEFFRSSTSTSKKANGEGDDHDHDRLLAGGGGDDHHDDGEEDEAKYALLYTTLSFFGGIAIMVLLSYLIGKIAPGGHSHELPEEASETEKSRDASVVGLAKTEDHHHDGESNRVSGTVDIESSDSEDPSEDRSATKKIPQSDDEEEDDDPRDHDLCLSGISTGIALFLHNLPEGIITFVATVDDPSVGAALAIGIILHNIPEGLSVAFPVYFSTGKRWLAFWVSLLTGLAQPIGAALAYGILAARGFSEAAFGVLFGLASGMLVYIVFKNLMPTALRYDPRDRHTMTCFVAGMLLIAIALVVLDATGNHSHAVDSSGTDALESTSASLADAMKEILKGEGEEDGHHHGEGGGLDDHHHF